MNSKEYTTRVRDAVRALFKEGKVDLFIGYEAGSLPMRTRPAFISKVEDVDRLVFDPFCTNNLARYLPMYFQRAREKGEETPKIGLLVKGCDARSVALLVREKQVPRENVYILGAGCPGMVDAAQVAAKVNGKDIAKAEADDKGILITTRDGGDKRLDPKDVALDVCLECQYPTPPVADAVVGDEARDAAAAADYPCVTEMEKKAADDRWAYFTSEMDKCIRCYACRQACPSCYCKSCFAEQTTPKWIGVSDHPSDTAIYQIIRIFHMAGRCVDCGACTRACPVGIDLRPFTAKVLKDVKERYGYDTGLSVDETPPLAGFDLNDAQEFMTEP